MRYSYTLKRPLSSSSFMFSPRFPINRVLQGGLSFVFCKAKGKIKGFNKIEVPTKFLNMNSQGLKYIFPWNFSKVRFYFLWFPVGLKFETSSISSPNFYNLCQASRAYLFRKIMQAIKVDTKNNETKKKTQEI